MDANWLVVMLSHYCSYPVLAHNQWSACSCDRYLVFSGLTLGALYLRPLALLSHSTEVILEGLACVLQVLACLIILFGV